MIKEVRPMRTLRWLVVTAVVLSLSGLADPAPVEAQDRSKTKEIIVAFAAEPRTLLPNTIVDWTTNDQVEHIYDRLVDRDAKTYKPAPMLATGWKIVNETTWEFTLRQGVKFQNGEPFNAASVKATMDYIKDPANNTHYLSQWTQVKEVQIVNDSTVRFITDRPWPPSPSGPGRSSSCSGHATRSSCWRRTPTTGKVRPTSTASPSGSSPSS